MIGCWNVGWNVLLQLNICFIIQTHIQSVWLCARWTCFNKGKSISSDMTGLFMESYEEECGLNPHNNEFIPAFLRREVDDVHCIWQYGKENI